MNPLSVEKTTVTVSTPSPTRVLDSSQMNRLRFKVSTCNEKIGQVYKQVAAVCTMQCACHDDTSNNKCAKGGSPCAAASVAATAAAAAAIAAAAAAAHAEAHSVFADYSIRRPRAAAVAARRRTAPHRRRAGTGVGRGRRWLQARREIQPIVQLQSTNQSAMLGTQAVTRPRSVPMRLHDERRVVRLFMWHALILSPLLNRSQ
jgi:hypothetical protein